MQGRFHVQPAYVHPAKNRRLELGGLRIHFDAWTSRILHPIQACLKKCTCVQKSVRCTREKMSNTSSGRTHGERTRATRCDRWLQEQTDMLCPDIIGYYPILFMDHPIIYCRSVLITTLYSLLDHYD